jgi:formylmethanofuran dehydrogenase subunit E
MARNKLLQEMARRLKRAKERRPDVPADDLVFSPIGPEHVDSIAEINERQHPMIFACLRVNNDFAAYVVEGSVERTCNRCGEAVWMSPATVATHDRIVNREIVCLQCMMP